MHNGRWLVPRHTSREAFEKDFPSLDLSALEAYCPGCRGAVKLARKSPVGKIGGWCPRCGRAVTA